MKSRYLVLVCFFVAVASAGTLREALVFHATFDNGVDAHVGAGDKRLYSAPKMAFPPQAAEGLPASRVVTHEKSGGVRGGFLKFQKKSPEMVFYKVKGNMPYESKNWSGTVSFWLRLTPDEDLEPGFTDPIQITSKSWDNASFFVEFSKDETPREFRLGIYPDFEVWNPNRREWNTIPMSEKPLAPVIRPPFKREAWTHVAFTFENFNSGEGNGKAQLYLNGKPAAALPARTQTFTWDLEKALIMLGLSYVGDLDELAIFKRALSGPEVARLHELRGGLD
jgi:hypothetical protein